MIITALSVGLFMLSSDNSFCYTTLNTTEYFMYGVFIKQCLFWQALNLKDEAYTAGGGWVYWEIARVSVPPGREHWGLAVTAGTQQVFGTEPSLQRPAYHHLSPQNLCNRQGSEKVEALISTVYSIVDYLACTYCLDVTELCAIPWSWNIWTVLLAVIGTGAYNQNIYEKFTNRVTCRHNHCALVQTKHRWQKINCHF